VAFLSFERWSKEREVPAEGDCDVVPDIAVEVLSPNDLASDVSRKFGEYFRAGVLHVWMVQPSEGAISSYHSRRQWRILKREDILGGSGDLAELQETLSGFFRRAVGQCIVVACRIESQVFIASCAEWIRCANRYFDPHSVD
jgi:Uma2 family endonuclease